MLLPSKELFWEVFKEHRNKSYRHYPENVDDIKLELNMSNEVVVWHIDNGILAFINIYELANKCKEWIYSKGYRLFISLEHPTHTITIKLSLSGKSIYIDNNSNAEPEAIFKACECLYKSRK